MKKVKDFYVAQGIAQIEQEQDTESLIALGRTDKETVLLILRILLNVAGRNCFIAKIDLRTVIDKHRRLALIVDDTMMPRACAKKSEVLAWGYDQ